MAIDVFKEQVVSLADAAKRLPRIRSGKVIHVASLYRWISAGKHCPDGSIAHLESIKIGGTICTSLEALQRFFDRLTGERDVIAPPTMAHRQRRLRYERVMKMLEEAGI